MFGSGRDLDSLEDRDQSESNMTGYIEQQHINRMNQYGGGDYAAEMNNEEGDKIPSMHNS